MFFFQLSIDNRVSVPTLKANWAVWQRFCETQLNANTKFSIKCTKINMNMDMWCKPIFIWRNCARIHTYTQMRIGDRRSLWCCCAARPPGSPHATLWWNAPALALAAFWKSSMCGQLDGSALAPCSQHDSSGTLLHPNHMEQEIKTGKTFVFLQVCKYRQNWYFVWTWYDREKDFPSLCTICRCILEEGPHYPKLSQSYRVK